MKKVLFIITVLLYTLQVFAGEKTYTDSDLDQYQCPVDEETVRILENNLKQWEQQKEEERRAADEVYRKSLAPKKLQREQITIKEYEQASWGGNAPFLEYDCKSFCFEGKSINSYLNDGWTVSMSRSIEIYEDPFKRNSWCRCTGAEYILERYR